MKFLHKVRLVAIILAAMLINFSGEAADLKQILRGTDSISSGNNIQTVTINSIDTAKSFLIFSARVNHNRPDRFMIAGEITNDTTLTFYRWNIQSTIVNIEWQVFEFLNGVTVQRGTTSNTNPFVDVLISPVDTTKSFVICTITKSGGNYDQNAGATAELTDSNNLRLRGGDNNNTVYWQVIEYDSCRVQKVIKRLADGSFSDTAIIDAVNTGKTLVIGNHRQSGSISSDDLARTELVNDTVIAFAREGDTEDLDFVIYVIEFTDSTIIQHGSVSFVDGETNKTVNINPVDTNCSGVIAPGNFGRQGSTTFSTDDNVGHVWFTFELNNTDSVMIKRAASGESAVAPYQVVEFSGSACARCNDGIQNQGETGVDCGGPCFSCSNETCSDGKQNQDETGVDCGGVCPPCSLNIPTVFTPNSDGTNDTWKVRGIELYSGILIEVYNRWGSLIFSSPAGYPVEWDGIGAPDGVYYYIITLGNGESPLTGTVTIVR